MLVYKIFLPEENAAFEAAGVTDGAPLDVTDGYIHLSTITNVLKTASNDFAGKSGLKLLAVESGTLGDTLKWERARDGFLCPNLCRQLRKEDVVWTNGLILGGGSDALRAAAGVLHLR
jgi:uncharacterized protein (DUF952 family)